MSDSTTPLPPSADVDYTSRIDRQEKTLDRLLEWIRAVDAKTPIVMAIATAMLGVLAAISPAPDTLTGGSLLWIVLGGAPLAASVALCALATSPQTTGPENSMIYFGGIVQRPFPRYAEDALTTKDGDYFSDLVAQSYRNAEIAAAKYKYVRRALHWLIASVPTWLAALYALTSK